MCCANIWGANISEHYGSCLVPSAMCGGSDMEEQCCVNLAQYVGRLGMEQTAAALSRQFRTTELVSDLS